MKNYFNSAEASNHLIMMTAMLPAQNFIDGNCITEEERKILKRVMKGVSDFSESVFERLGEGYRNSLVNKGKMNCIRLVSRDVNHRNNADMVDYIDDSTLRELLKDKDIDCSLCSRTDCLRCGIYKIKSYLHYEGKQDNGDLCPFRLETEDCEL